MKDREVFVAILLASGLWEEWGLPDHPSKCILKQKQWSPARTLPGPFGLSLRAVLCDCEPPPRVGIYSPVKAKQRLRYHKW